MKTIQNSTLLILLISSSLLFSGCGTLFGTSPAEPEKVSSLEDSDGEIRWLASGSLSYGGPVLALKQQTLENSDYQDKSYGFAPGGPRTLQIDLKRKSITLLVGGTILAKTELLDTSGLSPGSFNVAHKQRNPLWYAPDQYFSARGMSVPGEGDKLRFLRGAYGDFAIFINPEEAIHSGPFALEEINGVRCQEKDLAKIFYSMEIGDNITISE